MVVPRFPEPQTVVLGKYRVDSLIGEGGMGAVIKAHHIELDEFVAIKCLLPEMMDRKDIVSRFIREAKAAVKLKGEHVARVIDVGRLETGVPYIVMEYLEGADLNAIIKHHGPQDPKVVVDLMLQACEAIAEAHSIGIIHRDIKASNFFVTQPANQAPVLKVLDFGIATAPEGTSDLTSTQSVIGTPAYMAPEQMRSSRTADARSDIWSMGVVLYELLEGKRPFRSDAYSELCLKVGMDPPAEMEQVDVPEPLRAVVMKCLEKPVERRYQSVAELAFDLMPFATEPVMARASVEQCARLLGRKGNRVFGDVSRAPDDRTPAPVTPPSNTPSRLTPQSMTVVPPHERTPGPMTPIGRSVKSQPSLPGQAMANVLGRPTPMPNGQPKTPTSIGASSGQVSSVSVSKLPELKPRRRGLVIGLTVMTMLGISAGAYIYSTGGDGASSKPLQPAAQPIAAPEPAPTPEVARPVIATKPEVGKPEPAPEVKPEIKPESATPEVAKPVSPVVTKPVTIPPGVAIRDRNAVKPPPVKGPPRLITKSAKPDKGSGADPGADLYIKRQ